MDKQNDSTYLADLTFQLLVKCQKKEAHYAKKYGIPVAEFRCLRHLYLNPRATVKDLASYMNLTSSRLTRIIDKLHKKDLVVRNELISDRRFFIVELTREGKKLAKELYDCYVKLHDEIFSSISPSHYKTITQSLEKLLNALDLWLQDN